MVDSWKSFIHTHHYEVNDSFSDSWLAKHPRRSGEVFWNQYFETKFINDNTIPDIKSLTSSWKWFKPLLSGEEQYAQGGSERM